MKLNKTYRAAIAVILTVVAISSCKKKSSDDDAAPLKPEPEQFLIDCRNAISNANSLLNGIIKVADTRTEQNTLVPLNEIWIQVGNTDAKASLYSSVHPDKTVQESADTCSQEVSAFTSELGLNRDLYDAIKNLSTTGMDDDAKRLVTVTLRDFTRSGVDKDDAAREKIKKFEDDILKTGQDFGNNITDDVRSIELDSEADLEGLPEDYITSHRPETAGGKFVITTDYPDSTPFFAYAKSDEARRRLMYEFKNRAYPKNLEILENLLTQRYELATLLGYDDWAAYITEDKMIRTKKAVAEFIDDTSNAAADRAEHEYATLLEARKKDDGAATSVGEWQKAYYEEIVKGSEYGLDSKTVREYFAAQKVKDGLLELVQDLYGVKFEKATDATLWHESVEAFDVFDAATKVKLGRIFLDLYPRENKYKHAAQFTLKDGIKDKQFPEGVLVCNFPEPSGDDPGLMEHDDVVTMFHEFGHLLHHIFGGQQKWKAFSGVATEWDFVEVPSQLFEEWAWDYKVLSRFAKHYKTDEVIPEELVVKMNAANKFGVGLQTRHQMFYASISLGYYNQNPENLDTTETLKTLQAKYSMYPYMEDTHFQTSFGHLDGYSAIYYTYMWSLVIAKDLLSVFRDSSNELDLLNPATMQEFREKILASGGSHDAADLVVNFLGRSFTSEAFKNWLSE